MNTWTLFTLAVGLSMDAFAVAVCKGTGAWKNYTEKFFDYRSLVWRFSGVNACSWFFSWITVQQIYHICGSLDCLDIAVSDRGKYGKGVLFQRRGEC